MDILKLFMQQQSNYNGHTSWLRLQYAQIQYILSKLNSGKRKKTLCAITAVQNKIEQRFIH